MRHGLVAVLLLVSVGAHAQQKFGPPPRRLAKDLPIEIPDFRINITNLLVGRVNPLGLENQLRIGPQKKLYHSDSLLFRDNFVFFGFSPRVNPAFVKIGPSLELQFLSILNLRFGAELLYWFGTFNLYQSFGSPLDEYSDTVLGMRNRDLGLSYRTSGGHFYIEPTFQVRFGPMALRNRFSFEYWTTNARAGDTVFYDQTLDTLVPTNGWIFSDDLDLLYISKKRFVVGVRYSTVQTFYRPDMYRPGEDPDLNPNGHHRLGPLFAYTFFDKGYTRFNRPSLILIVNWYAQHRYRTGADVHPGIPYAVLGFAFTSDLIPSP
jgi:hypothetical protein